MTPYGSMKWKCKEDILASSMVGRIFGINRITRLFFYGKLSNLNFRDLVKWIFSIFHKIFLKKRVQNISGSKNRNVNIISCQPVYI
jgi:hypothetical protein